MRLVRVFLGSIIAVMQGMAVTFANLAGRRKITLQYPYERPKLSARYRGLFSLPFDEQNGRLKCVGCTLCAQACPTKVITMTKLGAGKHAGVSAFDMDLGRCMFCNLCIEACPFDAIHMGDQFELASSSRTVSHFGIEELAVGGKQAVSANCATIASALETEASAKNSASDGQAIQKGAA